MIKKITTIFIFLIAVSFYGQQKKINNFKYVIVPERFDFLKHTDQYQTSSLTKFLLKKKGFTVFLSNEKLPNDLLKNRCLALTADVVDASGMLSIKNRIELKDCYGNIIYTSKEGKSKEKDYKKGYHEAIRKAYDSMEDLEYSYKPLEGNLIKKKVVREEVIAAPVRKILPVKKELPVKSVNTEKSTVPLKATKSIAKNTELTITKNVLYAQAVENGFQLVDTKPSLVFKALRTKVKDVYILQDKNGILYKTGNDWVAEYYNNTTLVVEKYQIKF